MIDFFDQIQVTEFVRREHDALVRSAGGGEDRSRQGLARRILGLRSHAGRHVRLRYQDILGVGLAQLKAPGAQPALWTHKPNLRETFMEVVDIDEFTRWDPIEMLQLKSPDPNVFEQTVETFTQRTTAMATRNEQRTDWMIWEALKGVAVLPYPNAAPLTVNYGIPAAHFPTFATAWTDIENSDPIGDLWALGAVAIPASGIYLSHHHMSFQTERYMLHSKSIVDKLSSYGRNVMVPTQADLRVLLREGSTITVTDDGWIEENSTEKKLNKWIEDGQIFTTTPDYTYAGREIGWTADGWVLVSGNTTADMPVGKQGRQSEWIYNRVSQQTLFRQASSRMPIINAPEALAWATAYPEGTGTTF
jgi:Phage major capsid protein E